MRVPGVLLLLYVEPARRATTDPRLELDSDLPDVTGLFRIDGGNCVRHVGDHLPHSGSSRFLDIRRSETSLTSKEAA